MSPIIAVFRANAQYDGNGRLGVNQSVNTNYNLAFSGNVYFNSSTLVLGGGEQSTPVQTIFRGPQATGTDVSGADIIFQASNGTGAGGSGRLRFQTASAATVFPTLITSSSQTSGNTNSFSFSFTVPSGYSSSCLILLLAFNYNSSGPNSVTYNGVSMTNLYNDSYSNNILSSIYYLTNPSQGSNSLVIPNSN